LQVGGLLLGIARWDERMQKLFKTLRQDGKALRCNHEKETSNGVFEELVK
jgi:hypothetical protein